MKKFLAISTAVKLSLTSIATFAGGFPEEMPATPIAPAYSDVGVYLGIEGGLGATNWKQSFSTKNDRGIVGRAFLGYDFNRYFATELGYSYFFNKTKVTVPYTTSTPDGYQIKTQSLDLVGKGKIPVIDNFSLFAKFGVGYLMSNVTAQTNPETYSGFANHRHTFNIVYGVGADYNITSNIIANIEWLRVSGNLTWVSNDDLKKLQRDTDAFMIGLRYKFDL